MFYQSYFERRGLLIERLINPTKLKRTTFAVALGSSVLVAPSTAHALQQSAELFNGADYMQLPSAVTQPDTTALEPVSKIRQMIAKAVQAEVSRNEQRVAIAIPTPYAAPSISSIPHGINLAPMEIVQSSPSPLSNSSEHHASSLQQRENNNQQLAKQMAAAKGWTGEQWTCLDETWTQESHYDEHAENSSSGAYGIPQSLPRTKMATAGPDYESSPATQIKWGLGYIAARYKSPCEAWQHEVDDGWN
jgi:hypothetical protein